MTPPTGRGVPTSTPSSSRVTLDNDASEFGSYASGDWDVHGAGEGSN